MDDADSRAIPDWLCNGFDSPVERYEFEEKLFRQNKKPGYYRPHSRRLERLLASVNLIGKRPVEPSFWHVLRTNLNGGGIV